MKNYFLHILNLGSQTILLGLLSLLSVSNTNAQDAVFSQYYASALYLNPALAGLQPNISLHSNYRVQWTNINPFTTAQVSLIYPFLNKKNPIHSHWGGIGISAFQDIAGNTNPLKNTGGNFNFAYNINLGDKRMNILCFGIQTGFIQQQFNNSNFIWGTQYTKGINDDEQGPQITTQKIYPSIAGGAFWYYDHSSDSYSNGFKIFAGVAGYHLNRPNRSLLSNQADRLPILAKFHTGLSIPISKKLSICPNGIYLMQGLSNQLNIGGYFNYLISAKETGLFARTELIAGGWYRFKDAIILNTGINTQYFSLGLSYDLNQSSLSRYTNSTGAYELSIAIKIPKGLQLKHYATPRI